MLMGSLQIGALPAAAQKEEDGPILRGTCSRDSLQTNWPRFETAFDFLADSAVTQLKRYSQPVHIVVFLGTWCSDSQRDLPRFFEILDELQNPAFHYELYGLDRSKRDAAGLADKYNIENVPTFVFEQDGREIGRIVEKPRASLEEDWLAILTEKPGPPLPRKMRDFLQGYIMAIQWRVLGGGSF